MKMSIEDCEYILMEQFNCDRTKANIVANLLSDYDIKIEGRG